MTKQDTHTNIRNHVAPNLSDWRVHPNHVEALRHYLLTYCTGRNWALLVAAHDTHLHLVATKPLLAVAQAYCHALEFHGKGMSTRPEAPKPKREDGSRRCESCGSWETLENRFGHTCNACGHVHADANEEPTPEPAPTPYQEALADVVIPVEDALKALVRSDLATTRGCKVAALVRAQSMLSKAKRELSKLLR